MINRAYIEVEKLVELIVDNRGKSVPTVKEGIPLIATNCIKVESIYPTYEKVRFISQEIYSSWFRAHLKPNDILFVNKGTPGRACLVPNPVEFVAAQDMVGLRFKKEYDPYYMLAVIRSKEIQKTISNNHVGVVIPHFRKQELLKLKLPILNINIRNSIGQIYRSISEKIELNNKINQELEAMTKLLYDYWFVQFDFPDANGKPYKASGGKMVYNEELKREIPQGWEVKKLLEITSFLSRGISPKYINNDGVLVINQKCIRNGTVLFDQAKRNDDNIRNSSKKRVELNDVLVNSTGVGTLGRVSIVRRFPEKNITVDSHVTIVRVNEHKINKIFFGYSMLQKQLEIERFTLGSTGQVELNRYQLESLNIILPPNNLQIGFHKFYTPISQQIANNEKQNQKLAELRDWLLPMLMNGQVTVDTKSYTQNKGSLGMVAEEELKYGEK